MTAKPTTPVRVWCCVNKNGNLAEGSNASTEERSMQALSARARYSWKDLYDLGYRCRKFTLTPEETK